MTNNNEIVKKIEDKIGQSPAIDTILKVFKIGLSVTKLTPITTLISTIIPSRRLIRVEKFALLLADDLQILNEELETEYIKTDEFAFIFEQCFKAASENYQDQKLEAFRAIIINSIVSKDIDQDEKV